MRWRPFTWLCIGLFALCANMASGAYWYVPLADQVPGGFDHIQVLMAGSYLLESQALFPFMGSPAAETWSQLFINDSKTFAAASGPNLGDDPIYFDVWVDGDRIVDRPIFQYQAYRGNQLVSTADIFCTGAGETDWVIQPGTWRTNRPAPEFLPGDADKNTSVDIQDLSAWQLNYSGPLGQGKTWAQGDWTGDGAVDIRDLSLWQLNYTGPNLPPTMEQIMAGVQAVPEPASLGMLLVAAMGLMVRRRPQ